jgi:SpoVK/Ycf46/Vps4 family AAA+-type ATPase
MKNQRAAGLLEILDDYRSKQNLKYKEYLLLLNIVNYDYFDGGIFKPSFNGDVRFNDVFSDLQNSATETSHNSYDIWKRTHEIDISSNPIMKPIENVIKTKVEIDVNIDSLNDVISILDKYECKPELEYNIDMAALHNIKSELIQINNMIGMEKMKKSLLDQLLYFIQNLHQGKTSEFKHTVITGPPGTGKTEIAKMIGAMYSKIGILKKNYFKKVTRSDLVAGYLGQTAIKTRKVIEECLGGVLFIDEAYSLANFSDNDSYSKECIDTLCEALSDHKDNLMVIIAGYEEELEHSFFPANRGLASRFIWRFNMDDYNAKEMMEIFKKKVLENEWAFFDETEIKERWFHEKKAVFKNFGRDMELLFTYVKIKHSRRIFGKSVDAKKKLTIQDMNAGFEMFLNNRNKKKESDFMHTIFI